MQMAVHGRSGDLEAYLVADILFHRTLLEASGNEMLGGLGNVVAEVLTGRTHHHLMPARPEPIAISWHAEVAQAVQSGDAVTAERTMCEIVEESIKAMLPRPMSPVSRGDGGARRGARWSASCGQASPVSRVTAEPVPAPAVQDVRQDWLRGSGRAP
jgi:hypothetical protein